jgi:hypothetical protein
VAQTDQKPLPMGRSLIMMMGPKRGLRQQLQTQARSATSTEALDADNPVLS